MKHFKTSQQEQTLGGLCRLSDVRGCSEEHLGIVQSLVWVVQGKEPKCFEVLFSPGQVCVRVWGEADSWKDRYIPAPGESGFQEQASSY